MKMSFVASILGVRIVHLIQEEPLTILRGVTAQLRDFLS